MRRCSVVASLAALAAACNCGEIAVKPARIAFAVQPSNAAAGAAISPAIQVTLQDDAGRTATSATDTVMLALGANPGGATVSGTLSAQAVAGVATFEGVSLDKAGAGYTLVASAVGLAPATSAAFDVSAGAATRLEFSVQPSNAGSLTAISPAVEVSVEDALGNVVPSADTVTLSIASGPGGASLGGSLSVAATNGVATFADLTLDRMGTYSLTASSGALAPATSQSFSVLHGPPASLVFTQQPTSSDAGAAIQPAVAVTVLDSSGNVASTFASPITLSLGVNPGSATLQGTTTVDAVGGVATFSDISLAKAASGYRLDAATAGLPSVRSSAFDIRAGAGSQLSFVTQPGDAPAGATLTPAIQIEVTDAYGNRVASTATISLSLSGGSAGAVLGGTTSAAAAAGLASFSNLSIAKAGTGYSLVAASGALASATSNAFSILVGPDAKLAFTAEPADTAAGQTLSTVRVEIRDAFDNRTASTATVDVALASGPSGAALSGTKSVAAVAGAAAFSDLSLARAGTGYSLAATSATLPSATSNAFSILAGAASKIAFSVEPGTARVNLTLSPAPTVVIEDAYGNPIASASDSITVALGANPGSATLSGTLTRATTSGVASFGDLSLNRVANGYTLAASSTKYGSVTSATFNVAPQSGLVYTDPSTGGKIRLVVNGASTPTTVVLELVAEVPLSGYSIGFDLPLDTTRVAANAALMTEGTALPAGSAPSAAAALLPASGPLAGVLVTGQSQKAAGTGAVASDSAISAGAVFYTVRLDAIAGAPAGLVFDGAALGPKFRAALRDKLGTDVVTSADFRIGRLELF